MKAYLLSALDSVKNPAGSRNFTFSAFGALFTVWYSVTSNKITELGNIISLNNASVPSEDHYENTPIQIY